MEDHILETLLKAKLDKIHCNIFLLPNKNVGKFQLCLKTAASLFPYSCVTFLIE